jgi:predicted lipid-binding transport protein (Tim44 family)
MRRAALILATSATLAVTAVAPLAPAEAHDGFAPGLAGGLIAGALIGGLASRPVDSGTLM